jgi:hypothetical protein
MRELTAQEKSVRDRMLAGFDSFLEERMPVLTDFVERLKLPTPHMVVADPERYIPGIEEFMRNQVVEPESRIWILARMAYYIGEVLIQRFSGAWLLNEIPDSRYFLRYVVGEFSRSKNPSSMVDPFQVASYYVDQPPGRSLRALLDEVSEELRTIE